MSRVRSLVLGWALALAAMALFCTLGAWQTGRMHEKQAMLDAVQRVLEARAARPLASAGDAARARDYDWAAGTGVFAAAPAVLLDQQQRDGRVGVRAYRVFVPDDGAMPLLVELGWLPLPGDRRLPPVVRPQGRMRIEGLLSPPPAAGIATAAPARQADGDVLALALAPLQLAPLLGQAALAPRVLRPDPRLPLGHARDLDILPNTLPPERHLGYAVQWFALALAALVTALILTFRTGRR